MTQSPTTVTYSLAEVLGQISQKLDRLDYKVEDLGKGMDYKLTDLPKDVDTKVEQVQLKFEVLQKDVVEIYLLRSLLTDPSWSALSWHWQQEL